MLLALVLGLVRPPTAYIDTGKVHVPLAISSWCWRERCGAPLAKARHIAYVSRNATVHLRLAFVPTEIQLAIGSTRVRSTVAVNEVRWRATRGGAVTLTATGVHGFVTYVGRLAIR
jgi:hypothetical protein